MPHPPDPSDQLIERDGWILLPSRVAPALVARLAAGLDKAHAKQRALQVRNGVGAGTDGTVHHLPCAGGAFLEFLEQREYLEPLERFFQGPYILNTFGGVLNLPNDVAYVGSVHRDLRTFSGDLRLMAQLLVMIDDFTEQNGATYLLGGSHRLLEKPSDEVFFKSAVRAVGRWSGPQSRTHSGTRCARRGISGRRSGRSTCTPTACARTSRRPPAR